MSNHVNEGNIMIKAVKYLCLIVLLSSRLFSFSEVPNKTLIYGTWDCVKENTVLYFSDNNRLEVRIIRKHPTQRNGVIGPKIMLGNYQFIARSIYTSVYDREKNINIQTHYELKALKADKLILKDRKTKINFIFQRDFAPTSQPALAIAGKLKKIIVNSFQALAANIPQYRIQFQSDGSYILRYRKNNKVITGKYEFYSNIIRLYQNNAVYNFYIAKDVLENGINVQDKDSKWLFLQKMR